MAQGGDWIDFHGAAGGDPAGRQRDDDEQGRDSQKRQWIGCTDAIQQTDKKSSQRQRPCYARQDSYSSKRDTLPYHEAQNVARLRTDSHANTDFMTALRYRLSEDSINAKGAKEQRQGRKDTEQNRAKTRLSEEFSKPIVHGGEVRRRQRAIRP